MKVKEMISPTFRSDFKSVLKHEYVQFWEKGGRGSTKSSFISLCLPILIIQHSDVNALVLRKVGNVLKDSVYNQVLWAIDQLGISEYFKATKNPLEIEYKPTGQRIFFRGADDPLKIKSIKPQKGYIGITWFEEVDQFAGDEEVRSILQSTNRGGELYWNFFSFNPPKSRDNWANIAVLEERADKLVTHSSYLDVPREWLGEQFHADADALKASNELAYRHEYLGEVTGTGGAVFSNIKEQTITDTDVAQLGYFYYGVDFGFAVDPFVWLKLAYDRKHHALWFVDEIYGAGMSNARICSEIKSRGAGNSYTTADSAEPRTIAELRNLGLNVVGAVKGPDSVEHGINWLQHLNAIYMDRRRTPNAYREFTCYEYERDRSGNFISRFPDKNNHTIDATRYALENIIGQRAAKVYSKAKIGVR